MKKILNIAFISLFSIGFLANLIAGDTKTSKALEYKVMLDVLKAERALIVEKAQSVQREAQTQGNTLAFKGALDALVNESKRIEDAITKLKEGYDNLPAA